jgi:two-component system sensor histidine kinase FlrB
MVSSVVPESQFSCCTVRLSDVIEDVPAGIIILNAKGEVVEHNQMSIRLLGCSLIGHLWREVLKSCFVRQYDDGHEISTKNGRRLLISTTSLKNNLDGQVILLNDQTETRKLQDLVNQQKQLSSLGQMVSALAHQIRTPLSAALLYSNHLCDGTVDDQKRVEFSHKLRSRLLHLERQVQDMLLFVRGELPLNDSISSDQFVSELRDALEFSIVACGAKLKFVNTLNIQSIKCNKDALINGILNLVNNAIQSYESTNLSSVPTSKIEAFRLIDIECCSIKDLIFVKVRDFGCGIDETLMQQLSHPFVTTKPQGTGLGLSVIRAVAKAHGGELTLENKSPGILATVSFPLQIHTVSISA